MTSRQIRQRDNRRRNFVNSLNILLDRMNDDPLVQEFIAGPAAGLEETVQAQVGESDPAAMEFRLEGWPQDYLGRIPR